MNQEEYLQRMQVSVIYVLNHEREKRGLPKMKGPNIAETRSLDQIINERIGETLDPNITEMENVLLWKDIEAIKGVLSRDLLRGNYDEVITYSRRMLADCELIEGSAFYNPEKCSTKYHKEIAETYLLKAGIMKDNPRSIAEMKLQLIDAVMEERYGDAATLKRNIERAERLISLRD